MRSWKNPSIKRTFTLTPSPPQGWLTGCDDDDDRDVRDRERERERERKEEMRREFRSGGQQELKIRYRQNTEHGQFLPRDEKVSGRHQRREGGAAKCRPNRFIQHIAIGLMDLHITYMQQLVSIVKKNFMKEGNLRGSL